MSKAILLALCGVAAAASAADATVGCAKGTYYWGTWMSKHYCVKCPGGTTSEGCTNCVKDPFHSACVAADVHAAGTQCAQGERVDAASDTGCSPCDPGTWNNEPDSAMCHDCPKGHFMPNAGMHACYKCDVGYYADAKRSSTCTKCADCVAGKFAFTPDAGTESAADCACEDCARGKYTAAGYSKCFDCPAGRFQAATGAQTCSKCPAGQYQPSTGSSTCFKCPEGFTTDDEESTSAEQCSATLESKLSCKAGTYIFFQTSTDSLYCLNCPRGQYGALKAGWKYGGECIDCGEGTYQPYDGKTQCYPCQDGKEQAADRTSCVAPTTTAASAAEDTTTPAAPTTTTTAGPTNDPEPTSDLDCKMGDWEVETDCTFTCADPGQKVWTRSVVRPASPGGEPCGDDQWVESCNSDPCPVHCTTTAWGGFGSCDVSCGSGRQTRTRNVVFTAKYGGSCPPLSEDQPCATGVECPQDCVMTQWYSWGPCSKACGTGTQTRHREEQIQPNDDGKACGHTDETRACHVKPCPEACETSQWSAWSKCSKDCGHGQQTRVRVQTKAAKHGGMPCGPLTETQSCVKACPVDCLLDAWTLWAPCSRSCGHGIETRSRSVSREPRHGGKACGAQWDSRSCHPKQCPVDCIEEAWGPLSPCSAECGYGKQVRSRGIARAAEAGGVQCGPTTEEVTCHLKHCPIDCEFSQWSVWGACSVSCGSAGTQKRFRTIKTQAQNGGQPCQDTEDEFQAGTDAFFQTQTCDEGLCPVHCEISEWGQWTDCSHECYNGGSESAIRTRVRSIITEANELGQVCPTNLEQTDVCNRHKVCPEDCVMNDWTSWTPCSRSCGGGSKSRTRDVHTHAVGAGAPCPSTRWEQAVCNNGSNCPVDCVYGVWTTWSQCSASCGGGDATRSRGIDVSAAYGGVACSTDELSDTKSCNLSGCPEDCEMSDWSDPPGCSLTCGGGQYTLTREVTKAPAFGGLKCGPKKMIVQCNQQPCPINCKVGEWQGYPGCSKTCGGGGLKTQIRAVEVYAEYGGTPCPQTSMTVACGNELCPVHCELKDTIQWSGCSVTCGDGTRTGRVGIEVQPLNDGDACPLPDSAERLKTQPCTLGPCPRACTMTQWGDWSGEFKSYDETTGEVSDVCSKECGDGFKVRSRTVHDAGHQSICPHAEEKAPCRLKKCPIDCTISDPTPWTGCPVSCGGGKQYRRRTIVQPAKYGGVCAGATEEEKNCATAECPKDQVVGDWAGWGDCSAECGKGKQSRTRPEMEEAEAGGREFSRVEHRFCNTAPCAVNCVFGAWGGWSPCTASCGPAVRHRFRGVRTPAMHGGTCVGDRSQEEACEDHTCPQDCEMGTWSPWSGCSVQCGSGGFKTRHQDVEIPMANGGKACPGDVNAWAWTGSQLEAVAHPGRRYQRYACYMPPCGVDCEMSDWSTWGTCTASCGTGRKTRTRSVANEGQHTNGNHGGEACKGTFDETTCNDHACPEDCTYTLWGPWTTCDEDCGGGTQWRSRTRTDAVNGGNCLGAITDSQPCNQHECDADCVLNAWGSVAVEAFTDASDGLPCSAACGSGTRTRSKTVQSQPVGNGAQCPGLNSIQRKEITPCNTQDCDIDCVMSDWTTWAACTATCGNGRKYRRRGIVRPNSGNGAACGTTTSDTTCGVENCPVNCAAHPWPTEWEPCDAECGPGTKTKTRGEAVSADYGGLSCAEQGIPLTATAACQVKRCAIDCELSDWATWSDCSVSCGDGHRTTTRTITRNAKYGGLPCTGRKTQDTQPCNVGICPVHCEVADWGTWGGCRDAQGATLTCGTGTQTRSRDIDINPVHGTHADAKACPLREETKTCNLDACAINCVMEDWGSYSECNQPCGGGTKHRRRVITTHAQHGGIGCTSTYESTTCNDAACDVNCLYSNWGAFVGCDASCISAGSVQGQKSRYRTVEVHSQGNGEACDYDSLANTETCDLPICLTKAQKCAQLFQQETAAGASLSGDACFIAVRTALQAGITLQDSPSGDCLWSYYTTADIREACPARVVTETDIAAEYPNCASLMLAECKAADVDCHAAHGLEIAQGRVYNADATNCPPPTVFSYDGSAAFLATVPANLDINTATKAELQTLYSVTAPVAQWIIDYRDSIGMFTSVDQLSSVPQAAGVTNPNMLSIVLQHAGADNAKPVVTGATPANNFCTEGEQVVIDWWDHRDDATYKIDGAADVALGNAKSGVLSGAVTLAKSGPWDIKFQVRPSPRLAASDHTDRVDMDIDGTTASAVNTGLTTIEQVVDGSFNYQFKFFSSNAIYANHMGIVNGLATCTATPQACVMHPWGDWDECSAECDVNQDGGGIQSRTRGIKTAAKYGGSCTDSQTEMRRCNNVACPWTQVLEAEDGQLGGCASFEDGTRTAHHDDSFIGAGYVDMGGAGDCLNGDSTIAWQVEVPQHGHYELDFRYATPADSNGQRHGNEGSFKIASDQVTINFEHEELVSLHATTATWTNKKVGVDLYKGVNTITLTATQHDTAKPRVDRLVVTQEAELTRCVPGTAVPISFAGPPSSVLTAAEGVELLGDGVRLEGGRLSGEAAGYHDLGALGPWSLQFDVVAQQSGAAGPVGDLDALDIFVNQKKEAAISGQALKAESGFTGTRKVALPVNTAKVSWKFQFDSESTDALQHFKVTNAVAVCQGCSDVTCERVAHGTGNKIKVSHPTAHRGGFGYEGVGEQHGNHHECAYSQLHESCQCTCTKLVMDQDVTCAIGQSKVTSTYKSGDGTMKSVHRCV